MEKFRNQKVSKPKHHPKYTKSERNWTKPYPCLISASFGTVLHSKSWEFYFLRLSVCDNAQNLNETESETFSDTKFFRYRIRYFFWYQIFTIPNPILFSIPNFFDTESDTFLETKFFQYRILYSFWFWYRIRNYPKNGKVSKPRSFETETSHSGAVANSESVKWVCLQQVDDCWDKNATQRQQEFREEQCYAATNSDVYQRKIQSWYISPILGSLFKLTVSRVTWQSFGKGMDRWLLNLTSWWWFDNFLFRSFWEAFSASLHPIHLQLKLACDVVNANLAVSWGTN